MTNNELQLCERFKKIRIALKMKQSDFSKELKLTQGHVSDIENARKSVSDRVIEIICLKFGINEVWLRTGEGGDDNMFTKIDPEDKFSINLGKLSVTDNKLAKNIVNAVAETDPEKLECIAEFMMKCLGLEPPKKAD